MGLIKCPDCGKEISDRASSCIHCGCPIEELSMSGAVRVKMPNNIATGFASLIVAKDATVKNSNGEVLWKGKHGENASFEVDGATEIIIDLGKWANPIKGTVYPRRKYSLSQDLGVHMYATYILTEVDVIDSDRNSFWG